MSNQRIFHMCQKCHTIVDKVYQKGYCKNCLVQHFKEYHSILNNSHALKQSKNTGNIPNANIPKG